MHRLRIKPMKLPVLPINIKDKLSRAGLSVGLDIGSYSIKLVKLRFTKDKIELLNYLLEPLSQETDLFLKKIAQSQDSKKVNISVSGPSTITRYAEFPRMNPEEFKQALKFEAQKHIPFQLAEVNIDGCILKNDLPDNKMFVLLAAVKKDFLNLRLKMYEAAGLKVNVIDIDSLAIINAFNFNYDKDPGLKNKVVALLDIGSQESKLNILENFIPRLSRDIHIAGANFSQKLVDVLNVDFKTAENLKIIPDKDSLNKVSSAVESVLANLAREIRTSFDYYESQNASSVERIYLSGAGSLFSGLKDILTNLVGIDVQYWDPLKNIEIGSAVDAQKLKSSTSSLAVAVGLALRS